MRLIGDWAVPVIVPVALLEPTRQQLGAGQSWVACVVRVVRVVRAVRAARDQKLIPCGGPGSKFDPGWVLPRGD